MISYSVYNLIHIYGIVLAVIGIISLLFFSYAKNSASLIPKNIRILGAICHGLGVTLILISGFGMLARLGIVSSMPTWIILKLVVWVLLGVSITFAKRLYSRPAFMTALTFSFIFIAGILAHLKPGNG
jgi:hypothetical protein